MTDAARWQRRTAEVPQPSEHRRVRQIADFLAAVSAGADEATTARTVAGLTADALGADAGVVLIDGRTLAAAGLPEDAVGGVLAAAASGLADVPGLGRCHTAAAPLDDAGAGALVVLRRLRAFDATDADLLRTMAGMLASTLRDIRRRGEERGLREALEERGRLLERLSPIVRSISRRTGDLQGVLDAITEGARDLLGDSVVGLRLLDPDDPGFVVLVSARGVSEEGAQQLRRGAVSAGVGGRAVLEDRLVVIEDYSGSEQGLPFFRSERLQTAMAAPVHEDGRVVGSLTVGSHEPGRRFSPQEREALLAFAEHASLALTDAKRHQAMREAQLARDAFLAMVSHELKTPLTVMMGTLRTIESRFDAIPAQLRTELLASAFERGRQLERLIDQLLQGARAELASFLEEAWLPDLVAGALRGFEYSRRLVHGAVPEVALVTDAAAVRGVLSTLLENAVAHSPTGTDVTVEVEVTDRVAQVRVRNAGALPAALGPEELFAPLQRGPDAASSGVGLGLYIANRLAVSLGGSIDVRATDGTVEFTFSFPYQPVAHRTGRPERRRRPRPAPAAPPPEP